MKIVLEYNKPVKETCCMPTKAVVDFIDRNLTMEQLTLFKNPPKSLVEILKSCKLDTVYSLYDYGYDYYIERVWDVVFNILPKMFGNKTAAEFLDTLDSTLDIKEDGELFQQLILKYN